MDWMEKNLQELKENGAEAEQLRLAEELAAQKKVRVRLRGSELNPEDKVVPVCLNGLVLWAERGVWLEVPESIARILADSREI